MPRSKPIYFATTICLLALAAIVYALLIRPATGTTQAQPQNVTAVAEQLDSLLSAHSRQPLIDHLNQLVANDNWQMIGAELAILRHGKSTSKPAYDYISEFTETDSGVKDFRNATRLGTWLGAMHVTLKNYNSNAKTNTKKLHALLSGLDSATDSSSAKINYKEDFLNLVADVQNEHSDLASAIELIGYIEATASDVTTPINTAIKNALRGS